MFHRHFLIFKSPSFVPRFPARLQFAHPGPWSYDSVRHWQFWQRWETGLQHNTGRKYNVVWEFSTILSMQFMNYSFVTMESESTLMKPCTLKDTCKVRITMLQACVVSHFVKPFRRAAILQPCYIVQPTSN